MPQHPRHRAATKSSQRVRRYLQKHAPDVGITSEEIEIKTAAAYALVLTDATCAAYGKERVANGIPVKVEDDIFWYHDGILHAANGSSHAAELPAVPPHVVLPKSVREQLFDSFDRWDLNPRRPRMLLFHPLWRWYCRRWGLDAWTTVRRTYAKYSTYYHTAVGASINVPPGFESGARQLESTLVFERPSRLWYEWRSTWSSDTSAGYIWADGDSVRYFDTRDPDEQTGFNLAGAIRRCRSENIADQRILRMLARMPSDDPREDICFGRLDFRNNAHPTYTIVDSRSLSASERKTRRLSHPLHECFILDANKHCIVSAVDFATHMHVDTRINEPIPSDIWQQPVSPNWFRKRLANRTARENEAYFEHHANDLGFTPIECERAVAAEYLAALNYNSRTLFGPGRLHGGLPIAVDDRLFWWRDGKLHLVDGDDNPYDLHRAPSEVTPADVAASAAAGKDNPAAHAADPAWTCEMFRYTAEVAAGIVAPEDNLDDPEWARLLDEPKEDLLEPVREAYQSCRTYTHTATGHATWADGTRSVRLSETLHFERPNRLAIDIHCEEDDGEIRHHWLRIDGDRVRCCRAGDTEIHTHFSRRGALNRLYSGTSIISDIAAMLTNEPVTLTSLDDKDFQRENLDNETYRLVHETPINSDAEELDFDTSYAPTIDAHHQCILAYESPHQPSEETNVLHITYTVTINDPIPKTAWLPPKTGLARKIYTDLFAGSGCLAGERF